MAWHGMAWHIPPLHIPLIVDQDRAARPAKEEGERNREQGKLGLPRGEESFSGLGLGKFVTKHV